MFMCNNCGYESIRWLGRCPSCQEWNTLEEFRVAAEKKTTSRLLQPARPVSIAEIDVAQDMRMLTGISELDRVLGGGIIPGSLVLFGGEPGIGKSTLLLQAAQALASQGMKVLYVTGRSLPSKLACGPGALVLGSLDNVTG